MPPVTVLCFPERVGDTLFSREHAVVELIEVDDDWYVRVVDQNGRETVNSFSRERLAVAYAKEHCRPLGLEEFDRV
jgi:hypothetical protein